MNAWPQKPMGIGQILDRTFNVYRKHFGKFFLLTLIFFAPLYIVQEIMLNDLTSMSMLPDANVEPFSDEYFENMTGNEPDFDNVWLAVLFLLLIIPLTFLVSTPISTATAIFMVKREMDGHEVSLKEEIKRAFSRFWPLAGSMTVYGLIAIGMFLAIFLFLTIVVVVIAAIGAGSISELAIEDFLSDPATLIIGGVLYVLILMALMLVPSYFLIRWAFFMPAVAMETGGIGLSKSWNLTKDNFWRVFGIYFVIMLMTSTFLFAFQMIAIFALQNSIIGLLLQNLLTLLISPLGLIAYAITYFDLVLRKEGADLEAMLLGPSALIQPQEEPEMKHE